MFDWLRSQKSLAVRKVRQAVVPDIILSDDINMGWLNIYKSKSGAMDNSNRIHATKHYADEASDNFLMRNNGWDRIACVLITYEEGDGLE